MSRILRKAAVIVVLAFAATGAAQARGAIWAMVVTSAIWGHRSDMYRSSQ
jgi:hypothetical protein